MSAETLQAEEFKSTSNYDELIQIVEERNSSKEFTEIREIAPSIHRVARLRGRIPLGSDISDICYDLSSFDRVILSPHEVKERFSNLISYEVSYYKLAENIAIKNAKDFGFYDRLDDFIDFAKDSVSRTVWINWKPENGEDLLDLHKRVIGMLRHYLVHGWGRKNLAKPGSYYPEEIYDRGIPFQHLDSSSPAEKPIFRLQHATENLPLPAIIAVIEKGLFTEQITSLALMKYYPINNGLRSIASVIGVKRDTLSSALDRVLNQFSEAERSGFPKKTIREIIEDLKGRGVMKYPSGKNLEFNNPRLTLLNKTLSNSNSLPSDLSERDRVVVTLATAYSGNSLKYSKEEIATLTGHSPVVVNRIIKRAVELTCR